MEWAWHTHGERVYTELDALAPELLAWCEQNGLDLNAKKRKALSRAATWERGKTLLEAAQILLQAMGSAQYTDFNQFKAEVEATLKAEKLKLSASDKNALYAAVSWYDEAAEKVVKKTGLKAWIGYDTDGSTFEDYNVAGRPTTNH